MSVKSKKMRNECENKRRIPIDNTTCAFSCTEQYGAYQRKRQVIDAVEIPRQTRQSACHALQPVVPSSQTNKPTPQAQPKPSQDKAQSKEKTSEKAPSPSKPDNTNTPTHPYAAATENAYLPPHECNFASKPPKHKDAAYHTQ